MVFRKKNNKKQTRQAQLQPGQDNFTFRRSRTLTGSISPKVQVTAENRSQLKTARLKIHELHLQRKRVMQLLAVVVLASFGLWFLITNHIRSIAIDLPQSSDLMQTMNTDQYKTSIKAYLNERPFEQFRFSLSGASLNKYLSEKHSEIASVHIEQNNANGEQHISLLFRKPILTWVSGDGQFFVDDKGVAFGQNYFPGTYVQVTDSSGLGPDASGTVASSRFIRFLGQMVGAVNAGGKGKVVSVKIPASTRQIDLRLEGRDYDIKTHIDRDPNQQAEDIIRALSYFDQKKIKPGYLDVRVPNKAYYQ